MEGRLKLEAWAPASLVEKIRKAAGAGNLTKWLIEAAEEKLEKGTD